MSDFKDEIEEFPQEIEKFLSGDVSIGGKKIPKILLIGAVIVIGAIVFVVLKNKGGGGGSTSNSNNPAANIPNAFTADNGSGSGQGGSGGSSNGIPSSGDLIGSIPLPSVSLPDLVSGVGISLPDLTQASPIPYMSTNPATTIQEPNGGWGDAVPVGNINGENSGYITSKPSNTNSGSVKRGVKVITPVTKKATPNNPLYNGGTKQTFASAVAPAVNSLKPITGVISTFTNFFNSFNQPKTPVKTPTTVSFSKLPSVIPPQPKVVTSYSQATSVYPKAVPIPQYIPYTPARNSVSSPLPKAATTTVKSSASRTQF